MPTLHVRIRAADGVLNKAKSGSALIFNGSLPAQHLNVGRLILSSTNIQTRYDDLFPENSGYFVQMPWLISGTTGGNTDMPPDSVYVCEGTPMQYTIPQPAGGQAVSPSVRFYTNNNESPALEYGVNHNTIPPQFTIVLHPSDFNGANAVSVINALSSIEINLYFSYL